MHENHFREYLAGVIAGQAITAADHNSYHIGQIVDLRMLLETRVKDY
jgi:hypothetical protein